MAVFYLHTVLSIILPFFYSCFRFCYSLFCSVLYFVCVCFFSFCETPHPEWKLFGIVSRSLYFFPLSISALVWRWCLNGVGGKHHRPPIKSGERNKTAKERQHYWHIANIANNNCVYFAWLLWSTAWLYADFQCRWNGMEWIGCVCMRRVYMKL